MSMEHNNEGVDPHPTSLTVRQLWSRRVAIAAAVLFFLSWAFPVAAGLAKNTEAFPRWWGVADVAIAFVLAVLMILISALVGHSIKKQAEDTAYRFYRILTHGLLAMVIVFFLFGERISWINCLTGFAWRSWLLLYMLPIWFTALGVGRSERRSSRM
jgi:Mg2+/Co2+ transporter CorB